MYPQSFSLSLSLILIVILNFFWWLKCILLVFFQSPSIKKQWIVIVKNRDFPDKLKCWVEIIASGHAFQKFLKSRKSKPSLFVTWHLRFLENLSVVPDIYDWDFIYKKCSVYFRTETIHQQTQLIYLFFRSQSKRSPFLSLSTIYIYFF